jgi:hypothetical protein
MREAHITLPELALIGATRAALGAGIGLLVADRLPREQRRAGGWTLLTVGVLSTVPLALEVLGSLGAAAPTRWPEETARGWRSEAGAIPERWGEPART